MILGGNMVIHKEKLVFVMAALLLSQQSFANETQGFYFGAGYYSQFLNRAGPLKIKTTDGVISDQKLSKYGIGHSPLIAFGYVGEFNSHSYRIELEGMHSSVKANNVDSEGNKIILYDKYFGESTNRKAHEYKAEVNLNQIENTSVTANIYYHWKNLFSPYVGIAIGGTRMKMFEKVQIRPAYQLKAGFDFQITEGINMHIGYRHFGALGNYLALKAKRLEERENGSGKRQRITTYPNLQEREEDVGISNKLFFTHGIEIGLTLQKEAFKTKNWRTTHSRH